MAPEEALKGKNEPVLDLGHVIVTDKNDMEMITVSMADELEALIKKGWRRGRAAGEFYCSKCGAR